MTAASIAVAASAEPGDIGDRIETIDWQRVGAELDARGWAQMGGLLDRADCDALIEAYTDHDRYRSTVVMSRHNFGRGEYRYYRYPLPAVVDALRTRCYDKLVVTANRWAERLALPIRYPTSLGGMLERCRDAGQMRPTPLILRYAEGDYNCLHQDLYGPVSFPLQLAVLLSEPREDFAGGELVLTEQRPRMQSRVHVVPLARGQGVVFAGNLRPVQGRRGDHRVTMRHGVSSIRHGQRYTLGVIFHDAV